MARTELPNGVILPAEYSDDWYEDMTSNLTKLDDVIGSDSEKLNADGVYFLRMSSAALTDSGTGNFSDLNSSYKIKTGDLVLDSVRKLYRIVSVDSANETFTVGNSLFKVTAESDLAPVAESGDYGDLDNKPDLNPYDTHLANTDIHVTAADKTKWNDNVNQSYVLRYASTSVTPSSTISYSVLNNTDNIKAGDSVIDTSGQVFLIASVDSVNQTVTVSAVLLTLALDANVMHLSGNETVAGIKTFADNTFIKSLNFTNEVPSQSSSNSSIMPLITTITYGDGSPSVQARLNLRVTANGDKYFYPHENNQYALGLQSRKWSEVRAVQYYYGSSDTEFSDKFVTTDTNQNIDGAKVFLNSIGLKGTYILWKNDNVTKGIIPASSINPYRMYFGDGANYASSLFNIDPTIGNDGTQLFTFRATENVVGGDDARFALVYNPNRTQPRYLAVKGNIEPSAYNTYECGTNSNKWKSFNGINPGSLSFPDLNNGLDISGYLDTSQSSTNTYTPSVNGWIAIKGRSSQTSAVVIMQGDMCQMGQSVVDFDTSDRVSFCMLPVTKDLPVTIWLKSVPTLDSAKFYPCLGNV